MSNNRDFKVKNGIQPTVYHEGLGTVVSGSVGYSLSSASYDSKSFSTATQDTSPADFALKSDGSKLFVMGQANETLYQYSLSTSWDISTASYDSVSFLLTSQATSVISMHFKPDGTKVYLASNAPNDEILQYSLSTAWDLSTISYDSKSFDTSSQSTSPFGLFFKHDGTKMYVQSSAPTDAVFQYSLSTAWDVSTASYDSVTFDVSPQAPAPYGIDFKSDGTKMYVVDIAGEEAVFQYTLSTAWDLSTASYDSVSFTFTPQDTFPRSALFGDSGSKLYMSGLAGDSIYQYSTVLNTAELDLSTGSVFEVTPTSDIQVTLSNPAASGTVSGATLLLEGAGVGFDLANASYDSKSFSVASQETLPKGLSFNNDGTKLYVVGIITDTVYQYSLTAAYDISTASYDSVSFSVASQATIPAGLFFSPDGTKFYLTDNNTDNVYQYNMSTAFDLSTASYSSSSFSYASQTNQGRDVAFNSDGTKMYVLDDTNEVLYQYSLSTAFDLSTASYASISLDVSSQDTSPFGFRFNNDGTKLFIVGQQNDAVYQYNLSTAFDLSTASYGSVSFSVSSQDTDPEAIVFKGDGTKMYILGSNTDAIYQYSTVSGIAITYDTAIEWPSGTAPTSPAIGETDVLAFNTRDGGSTYQGVLAIDGAK